MPAPSRHGFTLIELSIVLVIIGLLVGGVLVGRDLIRASEVRHVASEYEKLFTAIMTFRGKYNCLPGDCPYAKEFFGTNPAGCPPPVGSPKTTKTCNGDGDGFIAQTLGGGAGSIAEVYTVWQQLSASGLWYGEYRGEWSPLESDNYSTLRGTNNYWFLGQTDVVAEYNWFIGGFIGKRNILYPYPLVNYNYLLFTPLEMYNFDSKYDDGKPGFGSIQSFNTQMTWECVSPNVMLAPSAVYDLTKTGNNCAPVFVKMGF